MHAKHPGFETHARGQAWPTEVAPSHSSGTSSCTCQSGTKLCPSSVDDASVQFDYGVAPFPVPDGQVDTYGKGYLSGTIIGIASTSKKQNAAWELVKYLTTDTRAVVSFANAIHNIPSTNKALESSDLDRSQAVDAFIKIAQNPNSTTTPASPNGGAYQLTLQDVGYAYESGKETDLQGSLDRAAKQIDTDIDRAR